MMLYPGDPVSCSDKINCLKWVFDHLINLFDGRCGSLELPVTLFGSMEGHGGQT